MAFKCIALFALIAVAAAAPQHYYEQSEKSYQPIVKKIVEEHEEPANYDFEYAVHDDHTGDIKEQHESAKNGAVEGYYTLVDADGYKRIVHYTADHKNGFNAEVRREPVEGHKVVKNVQPVVVKKVVAQPAIAVHKYTAPVASYYSAPAPVVEKYVAPVVEKYVAAPVVHKYVAAPVVQKYVAAPVVQKYVAAPVEKVASHDSNAYTHVSFKGPASSYNY
jgi:hypothetical protein